jgi:hypothetical protein
MIRDSVNRVGKGFLVEDKPTTICNLVLLRRVRGNTFKTNKMKKYIKYIVGLVVGIMLVSCVATQPVGGGYQPDYYYEYGYPYYYQPYYYQHFDYRPRPHEFNHYRVHSNVNGYHGHR